MNTEEYSQQEQNLEFLLKRAKSRFSGLQAIIFGEISSMLRTAKLLPLYELQTQNPTFMQIVEQLREYRDIAKQVASMLGGVISQSEIDDVSEYLAFAEDLAEAIDANSPDSLCAAIAALDEKPYI